MGGGLQLFFRSLWGRGIGSSIIFGLFPSRATFKKLRKKIHRLHAQFSTFNLHLREIPERVVYVGMRCRYIYIQLVIRYFTQYSILIGYLHLGITRSVESFRKKRADLTSVANFIYRVVCQHLLCVEFKEARVYLNLSAILLQRATKTLASMLSFRIFRPTSKFYITLN